MATRIVHTHDTEENWNKVAQFVPKRGEVIVYDVDFTYGYERFKVGDGVSTISQLPFTTVREIETFFNFDGDACYADAGRITDYQ